ncbi:DUF551 domain-containing protein [Enterobacter cloacae]|uniref:DUF551 domain-containing protein n=1 Tax=Enterobacter cloacae TaxID=550 RepID=UPI00186607E4|nr:DUF551 domain-containing protein [Enterobacter cloacae]
MSAITRKQLRERAREKVKSLEFSIKQTAFADSRAELEEELELARIALASLEADPVGEVVLGEYDDCGCHPDARVVCIAADGQADWENFKDGTRLYTAPPVPVSVPECFTNAVSALELLYRNGQKQNWNERYTTDMAYASGVLKACRAAMLKGADGNSPVISDGWVACSERMPDGCHGVWAWSGVGSGFAVEAYFDGSWYRTLTDDEEHKVTHWMPLPAAPQQEVK